MAEFKMPKFVYKDKPIPLDKCYQELADMSYKSPVDVIYQGFQTKLEGDIFEAIQSYGVDVDKDELIKALQYDRDQYRKGFEDGSRLRTDTIKAEVAREIFEEIESVLSRFAYPSLTAIGNIKVITADGWHIRFEDYNTIKKKYTEDKE